LTELVVVVCFPHILSSFQFFNQVRVLAFHTDLSLRMAVYTNYLCMADLPF